MNKATPEDIETIHNGKATLVENGEWIKDSAYRVYKIEDRFIAIIVSDPMACWLEDWSAEYITEAEIAKYI